MASAVADAPRIALVGQPNCGKTSLFNLLTGARQKVATYAGVTVARKARQFQTPAGRTVQILDLPDPVVGVLDATQLRRHLRFALRVRRMGLPMVGSLNMSDVARKRGIVVDT